MASLTGQLVAETYKALLKVIDNDILTASEKQITDGLGGGSNVFIDSQGFLRANKYKITNGLATQFLKADGSLDTNTYLTSITGAQVITALGYTPVPTTRTITINGETHDLSANNSWTIAGTSAVWGNISGILSNQTDLQNALNAKFDDPTGTISQYIRGDGSIANFPTISGGLPIGGTAGQILSKIDSTDYNAHWIDNYATQTKNEVKLGATLAKGAAVYVSSANGTNMIVSAASNTTEATSSKTFGLLETGGVLNDIVKCVTFGLIAGLDTSTATAGDPVWLGVNGALIFGLANKPVAPAHMVYIGVVTRVQSNNGEIFVNVQNGFEIEELHDVLIQSKVNNQGLFYESSTGLWKNKSIATVLGYTPQAQLNGTGFVKASGTTISYDNSTYLTTADAAATYLALTGGTLSGNLTISSANPKLLLTDTDNNPDYSIQNYNGTFKISDETNSADRFFIYSTGIGYYNGHFKANKLYVEGGLSTQFIKGDGTLDTNTYLTATSLDGYLAKSGGTMTGDLNFYTLKTTRVGGNAYIRGNWEGTYWGLGAAATGHTIIIDQVDFSTGAYESITDVNLMLGTRTVVHSGNVATYALPITGGTVTGSITATSFVKSGGTSTQFLMADGSVTTLSSPVTGSGSAGYIPKWTTAANIGSSLIYDDGTSIGIAYSTPNKGGYGRTLTGASFGSASFGFEAVGGTTTNGGLVGGLSFILSQNDASRIVGSAIQSNLIGTTATNYGADLRFFAKADAGVIGEVARMTSAGLRVYGTIVKDGGTSSQYLMADGSVTTLSGIVTGSGSTNYIPKWTSASVLGNSVIYDHTDAISIATTANINGVRLQVAASSSSWISGTFAGSGNTDKVVIGNYAGPTIGGHNSALNSWVSLAINPEGGNVMIGTSTNSGFKFDVNGSSRLNGNVGIRITPSTAGDQYLTTGDAGISYTNTYFGTGQVRIGGGADHVGNTVLSVAPGVVNFDRPGVGGGALKIFSNGNIGINQTTDGGFKLDVNGSFRINGVNPSITTDSTTDYTIINARKNGTRTWQIDSVSGNFWLYMQGAANYALQISGSTGAASFLNSVTATSFNVADVIITSNQIYRNSSSEFYVNYSGTGNTILGNSTGRVGIGTTNPGEKFEVNGSIKATGRTVTGTSTGGVTLGYESSIGYLETWNSSPLIVRTYNYQSFNISGTQALKINTNGNILINTDTDAGYRLFVNGGLAINTGSFHGILGSIQASWGGSTAYPTLYGNTADRWVMHINPHISYTQNGVNGYSGTTYGAMLRMAGNAAADMYWDLGVGVCSVGADKFAIGRNGTALFTITNAGNVTATAFFESSDMRIKTLIDGSAQIAGIENLEAKLYEKNGKIELGYFAQDAESIMPHAVQKSTDGFLNLSYREIHTAKITRLEKEVAELKEKLNVA